MSRDLRHQRGREAEELALAHLKRAGLKPLARNYRTRAGEIDLVMRDGEELVFVEVRRRRSDSHGGALASVTAGKQRRLIMAARQYLQQHGDLPCRFDVIGLGGGTQIEWVRGAFRADY